jgi:hypothetical protein
VIAKIFQEGEYDFLWFFCSGCNTHHRVPVTGPRKWEWNGSVESPTLSPSIKVTWHKTKNEGTERVTDDQGQDVMHVCHTFVRDGQIQYLGDCTHSLAGQTVPLTELP